MKAKINSIKKSAVIFLLSAFVLINFTTALAAGGEVTKAQPSSKAIARGTANFIKAVKSDNAGLKKSAIYYIGYYQISDAVGALVKQLKKEKDPEIRTFIVLSLLKIGDEKGFKAIKSLAENDEDQNVRNTCKEISKAFSKIIDSKIAQLNLSNN